MNKTIIIGMCILTLLFLNGCIKNDITSDVCTSLKHLSNHKEIYVFMDNGVCIKESMNYSYAYDIRCESLFGYVHVIIKSQNKQEENLLNNIKNIKCEIISETFIE